MGGPSNCPELPAALMDNIYAWYADAQPFDRNRRSIYLLAKRNFTYPLFDAFDQPDRMASCPVRPATITAPQALAMLNGEFTLTQARSLAGVLLSAHGRDGVKLIRDAYLRTYSRLPDEREVTAAVKFLQHQARLMDAKNGSRRGALSEPIQAGLDAAFVAAVVDFCHALLNSAEFLDVE
jgi:hypothetical protein